MRRTRLVGAVAALLVLSLLVVPSSLPPRAQTAPAPATGAARMVFVAESGGLIALNAADATVLFEVADPAGVRAVAADEPRGVVWAYDNLGTLRAYRLDGTPAVTVALPLPPGYTSTTPVALVVHPEDGSVWLGVGLSLQHLDAQGTVLLTLTFPASIRVLALDPPRARIWVGTATSLAAYADDTGQVVASVALGGSTLLDAVVEPTSGHVFAALDTALRRYDLTGAIVLNVLLPLSSQRWVARDGAGGAWAATPNVLVRITSTAQLAVFQSPWGGPGPIVALAADPTDQTAWVASSPGAVTHVGPTGTFLHQLTLWGGLTVRDLAFMRDLVPPVVSFTAPLDGAALNTGTPRLELSYSDLGAGVDPATLGLTADGQALAASCTLAAASATCTPTTALADGAHTLAATVTDRAGNLSQPAEVHVTVDTVAPVVTLSAPAEGLLTNQASQTVAGSVSETATLVVRQVVNGTAVQTQTPALGPTHTFTSSPVTLAEGSNLLEVVALDAAGNRGAASRTVRLDTAPPVAVAATALSVGPVTTGQVTISGAAGSVESGARVTIRNVPTGVTVTGVANTDGSFVATIDAQAGQQLAITSTDGAGNTSAATEVTAGPPRSEFVDAFWVAASDGLRKFAASDGALLLRIAEPAGVRAVAVDEGRQVAWAYRPGALLAYSFTGGLLRSVPLALPADYTEATPVALAVRASDGSIWLGVGTTLQRIDAVGIVRLTATLAAPVVGLAVDTALARLWAGTASTLVAYREVVNPFDRRTTRLEPVTAIDLTGAGSLLDLAWEPGAGRLWVALTEAVRVYDTSAALVATAALPSAKTAIAPDGQGGVWLAATTRLVRLDGTGQVRAAVDPWPGSAGLTGVAGQPRDGSVWVASGSSVTHVTAGAQLDRVAALPTPIEVRDLALYADIVPPVLVLSAPVDGTAIRTNAPTLEFTYSDTGSGVDPETLKVAVDSQPLVVACSHVATGATCGPTSALAEGLRTLKASIQDRAGNLAQVQTSITVDTIAPTIRLTSPADGALTNNARQTVTGQVNEAVTLTIRLNGQVVETLTGNATSGFVSSPLTLAEGRSTIDVLALDVAGHAASATASLTVDTVSPAVIPQAQVTLTPLSSGQVSVTGAAGSAEPGVQVVVTNLRTAATVTVVAGSDGSFSATVAGLVGDQMAVTARDAAGNTSAPRTAEVVSAHSDVPPPDPTTIAPALDPTVATDLASATAFLYTGQTPIQTGVASRTIEPRRVAILRGRVTARDGSALSGVVITAAGHPEYGRTLSRADGAFDLAVNGGGRVTVRYDKPGYLPAQRHLQAPWRDYAWLPEVVLVPLDPQLTTVTFGASATMQVARGSVSTDVDGTRQSTLLIPAGTSATMVMPDGSTRLLAAGAVRATEYTLGATGPDAMPAPLPPTSGYTYAVELSLDEAIAAGARTVRFSQPVIQYVENFLGFPVGGVVPTGYYDRERAAWIPSDNGRIVKTLSIANGLADLDVTGSGIAADAAALSALGVTDAERQQLATLYPVGQSLWRVPITHFSLWDHNWPYGPPAEAIAPLLAAVSIEKPDDKQACRGGSIIECQGQILGEAVPIAGTPFRLHYQSDRVPGRRTANRLIIPVSGPSLPASLTRIELEISVAGRLVTQTFAPIPNQEYTFIWDGQDAYGRPLQGEQPVRIRTGYMYPLVYRGPADFTQSFARFGGGPITARKGGPDVTIWQEQTVTVYTVGGWDARALAVGGWTLSVHHAYDSTGRVLYLGNGRRRSARGDNRTIATVAGGGSGNGCLLPCPATQAATPQVGAVAVGADGSLYIAHHSHRVDRVRPDGVITRFAGTGLFGFSGDGGPATSAQLDRPEGVAVGPDGSVYIADTWNNRVRRVSPDGIITTIAGGGASVANDVPATESQLRPEDIAIGPDGVLYIVDSQTNTVRGIGPDGIIRRVAGGGTNPLGDGGPARDIAFAFFVKGIAVAPDGSLYIADTGRHRVWRVGPDGLIRRVAGTGTQGGSGDGGPALQATISFPFSIAVAPDGGFYILERVGVEGRAGRIRRVSPDGIITTVAGTETVGFSGDLGVPALAEFNHPEHIAVDQEGRLLIADFANHRVRRVGPTLPGFTATDMVIPAEHGAELYVFDARGRHLRTVDALTGVVLYRFTYDVAGRLASVTDKDGRLTTIERDGAGNPMAIVAPGGQRTLLGLDLNGYLASLSTPAGEITRFSYSPDGLLATLADPKSQIHRFTYDALGRLTRDDDPAGGFSALSRIETKTTSTVSFTTALGRVTTYRTETLPTGGSRRFTTDPSGLQTQDQLGTDGSRTLTTPDGMVTTLSEGPDPRFGMQAPLPKAITVTTPGGLRSTVLASRTVALSNADDLLSLATRTDTVIVNGRTSTSTFNAVQRTLTDRTPVGRQTVRTLDALGRLVQTQATGLEPVSFAYDLRGRLTTITEGPGPTARVTTLGYDLLDRLVSVTDPLGRTASFAYDLADRVTTQTLPDGRQIGFAYDANANVTSISPPGRPAHGFGYTPVNLEAAYTPPALDATSPTTTTAYNTDRQPTLITRPDGQTVSFGYDAGGRLSTLTVPTGLFRYAYSTTTGQLTTLTAPAGGTLSYTYDGALVTSETWGGPLGAIAGQVSWTYDSDFRLASESVNGTTPVTFGYDPDSLLTQAGAVSLTRDPQTAFVIGTALGSLTDTRSYSTFGELSSYQATVGPTPLLETQYSRDSLGRITQRIETRGGVTDTFGYTYDLAGRLTEVRQNGTLVASYGSDPNSNRTSRTTPSGTVTGTYDAQDRLLTYGDATYSYTANGELQAKSTPAGTTTYIYDVVGNLLSVTLLNGTRIDYVIDGRNRRIGKKVNGTLVQGFLYRDQLKPIAELDGTGAVVARFVYGSNPLVPDYLIKGTATYRILSDHLGSPRLVVDTSTGAVVQRLDYDEFGTVTLDTSPGFQPFGFAGGLYDQDTKLTRFGARDYEASSGRFTSKDPKRFGGGLNLYGYALNDPVQFIDPDGTQRRPMIRVPPPTAEELGLPNPNDVPGATGPTRPGDVGALFDSLDPVTDEDAALFEVIGEVNRKKAFIVENRLECGEAVAFTVCVGHTGGVVVPGSVSVLPTHPILTAPGQGLGVGPQRAAGHFRCKVETLVGQKNCSCPLPTSRR